MSSSVVIIPRQFFSQGNGGPNKIMAKPGMSSDPNENQTRLRTKATRCGGTHNACFAYKSVLLVCMLVYYYYYPNDHVHSVLKDAKKREKACSGGGCGWVGGIGGVIWGTSKRQGVLFWGRIPNVPMSDFVLITFLQLLLALLVVYYSKHILHWKNFM